MSHVRLIGTAGSTGTGYGNGVSVCAAWFGGEVGRGTRMRIIGERHPQPLTGTLVHVPAARMVHEDPAHDPCREPEELRAILPVHVALIDEAQIGLVHERGGLERMLAALGA